MYNFGEEIVTELILLQDVCACMRVYIVTYNYYATEGVKQ